MDLAAAVYQATNGFPKAELYGMTSQLRRAVVSIPSNIAEGQGRQTTGEFLQFLGHARGSLLECETQVLLAERMNYLSPNQSESLLKASAEVGRIINGLMARLQQKRR
jgi:four helix bundle protein